MRNGSEPSFVREIDVDQFIVRWQEATQVEFKKAKAKLKEAASDIKAAEAKLAQASEKHNNTTAKLEKVQKEHADANLEAETVGKFYPAYDVFENDYQQALEKKSKTKKELEKARQSVIEAEAELEYAAKKVTIEHEKAQEEHRQINDILRAPDDYDKIKQDPFVRDTIKEILADKNTEKIINQLDKKERPYMALKDYIDKKDQHKLAKQEAPGLLWIFPTALRKEFYSTEKAVEKISDQESEELLEKFTKEKSDELLRELTSTKSANAQGKTDDTKRQGSTELSQEINKISQPSLKLLILDKLKRLKQNDDKAITTILTQLKEPKTHEDWTAAIFTYEQAQRKNRYTEHRLTDKVPEIEKPTFKRAPQTDDSIIAIEAATPLKTLDAEKFAIYKSAITFKQNQGGEYQGSFNVAEVQNYKILYKEQGHVTLYTTESKSIRGNPQTGEKSTPANYPNQNTQIQHLAQAMYYARAARYGLEVESLKTTDGRNKKFKTINVTLKCNSGIDLEAASKIYLQHFDQVIINNQVFKNPKKDSDENKINVEAEARENGPLKVKIRARAKSFEERIDEINANDKEPVERFEAYAKLLHKVQSQEISFSTDGDKDKNIAVLQFYMMQAREVINKKSNKREKTEFSNKVQKLGLEHRNAWLPDTDMDAYFNNQEESELTLADLPLLAGAKTQLREGEDKPPINSAKNIHEWLQQLPGNLKDEALGVMYKETVTEKDIGTILELAALDYSHYHESLESRVKKDLWHFRIRGRKYNITANDLNTALGDKDTDKDPDHRVENLSHFLSKVGVEKKLDPLAQFDATQGNSPVVRLLKAKNHRFAKAYGATIVKAFKSSATIDQSIIEALLPLHHQLANLPDDDQYKDEQKLIKTMISKKITVGDQLIDAYLADLVKFEPNSQATPQQRELIEKYRAAKGAGHEPGFITNLKESLLVQVNDFPLEVFTYGIGLLDDEFDEKIIATVAGVVLNKIGESQGKTRSVTSIEETRLKTTIQDVTAVLKKLSKGLVSYNYIERAKHIEREVDSYLKENTSVRNVISESPTVVEPPPLVDRQCREALLALSKTEKFNDTCTWLKSYYEGPTKRTSNKKPKALKKGTEIYKNELTAGEQSVLQEDMTVGEYKDWHSTYRGDQDFKCANLRAANAWILSQASESYIDSDTKEENICYTNTVDSVLVKVENNEGKTEEERNKLLNENKNSLGSDGYMQNTELATFAHMLGISIKLITTHEHQATVIYDSKKPHIDGDKNANITLHLTQIEDNEGNKKAHYYADPGKSEDIAADGLCGWTALHKAVMSSNNNEAKDKLKGYLKAGITDYNKAVSEHKVTAQTSLRP
jgi:hypothetical protein